MQDLDTRATDPAPTAVLHAVAASVAALPARYLSDRSPQGARRYRLRLDGCPAWTVLAEGDRCAVWPGDRGRAHAELHTDPAAWLALANGDRGGLELFFDGRLRVHGDLNEALRLETLFAPPPGSPGVAGHPRVQRLRVGRVSIEAYVAGPVDGAPVLFLHGLGASKVSLLPAIAGLARTYRVAAIDLPGFGKSSAPIGARYDAGYLAAAAVGALDALDLDAAHVVGNSMGGRVAIELALRAPERVRALGLLCPAVAFAEYRLVRPLLAVSRPDVAVGLPWWPGGPPARRLVDAGLRSLFADADRVPAANLAAAREDFLRGLRDRRRRLALLAAGRRLGLERPARFWQRLGDLAAPTLWIFGDRDRLVAPAYAELVRRHLPAATVEVWDSCGHVPQFEHPKQTVARLDDFFAQASSRAVSSAGVVTGRSQVKCRQT